MMELTRALDRDTLLTSFFNEYLKLEVFGVKLRYNNCCLYEIGGALLSGQQDQVILLDWCKEYRWKFFLLSRMYTEYKLCSFLFATKLPVETVLMGMSPWRQLHLGNELINHAEKEPIPDPRYQEYQQLRRFLVGTHGDTLTQFWLCLEGWQVGVVRDRSELSGVREQCSSIPGLVKYSSGGPLETGVWVKVLKKECEDRLVDYWLPRFWQRAQKYPILEGPPTPYDVTGDPNEQFISGLRCNKNAGRPFEGFLQRSDNKSHIHWVQFWEAVDKFLLIQHSRNDPYVIREGWRLWSMFVEPLADCSDFMNNTYVPPDSKASLLRSLKESNRCSLVQDLSLIKHSLLSGLKRVWTHFLRLDHSFFTQYIKVALPREDINVNQKPSPKKSHATKKQKKAKNSMFFNLKGTPLEALGDFETLLIFEHYLFTQCGPKSQTNINYQLWRALKKLFMTRNLQKRDALAMNIHRNFLYLGAKQFIQLPDSLLEQMDNSVEVTRPGSPVLKTLMEFSAFFLQTAVSKFFLRKEEFENEDVRSLSSLPPMNSMRQGRSRAKTSSAMRKRNEAQHLLFMLSRCEGPISKQLASFGEYLAHQCPPTQYGQLTNNVRFWLEVQKFKALFNNEISIRVLYHKGEAIVDRYLDTATQPWVKVTVPIEVALQVVSAMDDLRRVETMGLLEQLLQLLERAQEIAFADIAPYWGNFCSQYTSPNGSTISIPLSGELSPPSSRRPTLQLPPIRRPIHIPLLSFSSHRGLKWKTAFQ